MVLESVRARYLAAGFQPDESIKQDLNYLQEALKAVRDAPDARPPDPTQPARKNVAGQLLNTVTLLDRNLSVGCDVFGHGPQFVPILSVATHQKALQDSLAVLKDNEDRYTNYTRTLQQATDLGQQMKTAAQKAGGMKTYLEGMLRKLNQERKETQRTIEGFQDKLDRAKNELEHELEKLKDEIKAQFGLSTSTLLNCLTQVAFLGVPFEKTMLGGGAPGPIGLSKLHAANSALLGATQLATALNEGLTSVLNDAGEPVKKEQILERLEAIEPGKFQDHVKARKDGTYKVDDPKLSIMREDLEQLCHQFRTRLKTQPLIAAMTQYVDLLDERGRHQLKYNSQVAEQFELVSELRAATVREHQAQSAEAEAVLKAVPEMTALISSLYDRSRLDCLNELAVANRALAFWKGEPCGNAADLIPGKLSTVNYQTLNNACLSVQKEIIGHLDKAFSPPERFPASLDEHVERSKRSPFGVWTVLTSVEYPDQFADLQEGLPASFTFHPEIALKPVTPPWSKDESLGVLPRARPDHPDEDVSVPLDLPPMDLPPLPATEPIFPFDGKADVRLSQVRVFFPGLPSDRLLTVKVTHSGHEYIQNPNGQIVEFRHQPRRVTFAYRPPKDGVWIDEAEGWVSAEALQAGGSEDGSLGLPADKTALPGCSYTPLGPFTTWTIELPPKNNQGLNRGKIDRIVLDFHGFHREFDDR
jgi:hypothetical protein